jgi:sugar O-acyltransferase (sialic acid O-acetyltransferase NeuD family)
MQRIVIFGLGETAHLAYEYFTHDPKYSDYEVVAFCADLEFITSNEFCGLPVVSMNEVAEKFGARDHLAFAAASSGKLNRDRERLYNKAKSLGYTCISYVSSRAFIWHNVEIGENCFILEDNTLQPFVTVGNNVVLWSGNHVGHRTNIQDHCFITSHVTISGYCQIGEYSFIGVNASIGNDVTIGHDNFIGMGALINKNTDDNSVIAPPSTEKKNIPAKRFCGVRAEAI